jgi:hypothetical protein
MRAFAAQFSLALMLGAAAPGARAAVPSTPPTTLPGATLPASDPGARIDAVATGASALPRDRRAALARQLKALGPAALDALLARLGRDSPAMASLRRDDPAAARAFDAALLEAVGALRSPMALGALARGLEVASDDRVRQAAADGLGRLCAAGGFDVLASAERRPDTQGAARTALGLCRTERAAALLVSRLGTTTQLDEVQVLADALGSLGSGWAWRALGEERRAEGDRVRRSVAAALREALARAPAAARAAVREALWMVEND